MNRMDYNSKHDWHFSPVLALDGNGRSKIARNRVQNVALPRSRGAVAAPSAWRGDGNESQTLLLSINESISTTAWGDDTGSLDPNAFASVWAVPPVMPPR